MLFFIQQLPQFRSVNIKTKVFGFPEKNVKFIDFINIIGQKLILIHVCELRFEPGFLAMNLARPYS